MSRIVPDAVANATPVNPGSIDIAAAPLTRPLASAEAVPTDPGITATRLMPAVTAAGVRLVLVVLAIAAASILLLVAYLFSMDLIVGWDVQATYGNILGRNKLGAEVNDVFQLKAFEADLAAMRDNAAFVLDPGRETRDRDLVASLKRLPSLSLDEKTRLDGCIFPPSTPSLQRMQAAQACVDLIRTTGDEAIRAAGTGADLQAAADAITKLADGRQALHAFWLQAAQLVLLNLLLPIMTALLGYIFGTQQQAQHDRASP